MDSVSRFLQQLGPARLVFQAIVASAIGILLLLGFILGRRAWRRCWFRKRDAEARHIRENWESILDGSYPSEKWMNDALRRELVETMLLDHLETARAGEARRIQVCLRRSGLLDRRIGEAREADEKRKRQALMILGRTMAAESIPSLGEALTDPHPETRLAAVRGLGRLAIPEAAVPILERLMEGHWPAPYLPLQNSLLNCCRWQPSVLLPYLRRANAESRALLARVLGEVATGDMDEDLLMLAFDEQPEVRASAARSLSESRLNTAISALGVLSEDDEWFVRLRAVVALGRMHTPRAIPLLVAALCDRNRFVRLRAALALARLEDHLELILELVEERGDRYAMQALVSELERSGTILALVEQLAGAGRERARRLLLRVLHFGAHRMLLASIAFHRQWRVRTALARLLAESGERELLPLIEKAVSHAASGRERRILRWVARNIEEAGAAGSARVLSPAQ